MRDTSFSALEMVEKQLKRRGIADEKVLQAMLEIPRQLFLPESKAELAYSDGPVEIGFGQTISQPFIVAYMTEQLRMSGTEIVLEVGTGSGYQTAVLAKIARQVYTIELIAELSEKAYQVLQKLNLNNVSFLVADGKKGWPDYAPFDRIIVTAAARDYPAELVAQLKDGGIMVWPEGDYLQYLFRIEKEGKRIEKEQLLAVSFVPLK